jgi:transmembrane sensor
MNNRVRLQQLLDKYLRNTCSKSEMDELFNLMKRAENEDDINQALDNFWQEISETDFNRIKESSENKEELFQEIYSKALAREGMSKEDRKKISKQDLKAHSIRRNSYPWIKVAAVLLVGVFIYLFHDMVVVEEESEQQIVYIQKTSEAGEKVRFMLPDGTQVHLNSESILTYPESFYAESREVHLEGEAYFVVSHDESLPFLIHTSDITTKVLGTSFNVRAYPEDEQVSVAVARGKVALSNQGYTEVNHEHQIILEADEWVHYSVETENYNTGSGDISRYTAWNENVLLYHDKKMSEVALQLERWYGVTISFENVELKQCVIRGEHRNEPLVNVLDAISYAFDMDYHINERNVVITGNGCSQ